MKNNASAILHSAYTTWKKELCFLFTVLHPCCCWKRMHMIVIAIEITREISVTIAITVSMTIPVAITILYLLLLLYLLLIPLPFQFFYSYDNDELFVSHCRPLLFINSCISLYNSQTCALHSPVHGCYRASRQPSAMFVHSCSHSSASIWCWVVQCDPPGSRGSRQKNGGNDICFFYREGKEHMSISWISKRI